MLTGCNMYASMYDEILSYTGKELTEVTLKDLYSISSSGTFKPRKLA